MAEQLKTHMENAISHMNEATKVEKLFGSTFKDKAGKIVDFTPKYEILAVNQRGIRKKFRMRRLDDINRREQSRELLKLFGEGIDVAPFAEAISNGQSILSPHLETKYTEMAILPVIQDTLSNLRDPIIHLPHAVTAALKDFYQYEVLLFTRAYGQFKGPEEIDNYFHGRFLMLFLKHMPDTTPRVSSLKDLKVIFKEEYPDEKELLRVFEQYIKLAEKITGRIKTGCLYFQKDMLTIRETLHKTLSELATLDTRDVPNYSVSDVVDSPYSSRAYQSAEALETIHTFFTEGGEFPEVERLRDIQSRPDFPKNSRLVGQQMLKLPIFLQEAVDYALKEFSAYQAKIDRNGGMFGKKKKPLKAGDAMIKLLSFANRSLRRSGLSIPGLMRREFTVKGLKSHIESNMRKCERSLKDTLGAYKGVTDESKLDEIYMEYSQLKHELMAWEQHLKIVEKVITTLTGISNVNCSDVPGDKQPILAQHLSSDSEYSHKAISSRYENRYSARMQLRLAVDMPSTGVTSEMVRPLLFTNTTSIVDENLTSGNRNGQRRDNPTDDIPNEQAPYSKWQQRPNGWGS